MMNRRNRSALLACLAALLMTCLPITGCKKNKPTTPDFYSELGPGEMALRKIPPEEYPDFSNCTWNLNVVGRSIDQSLFYMSHASSRKFFPYLDISHERAVASLRALRLIVDEAAKQSNPGQYIDSQVRGNFEVYKSKGARRGDGQGYTDIVLFTGYCTPDRDASLVRTGPFQYPLYKRPADLAVDPNTGETTGRMIPGGGVGPYWTRAEIEGQNKLAGQEFVWLKSRWEAYIVTIQGSARLKLPDGRIMEIGYTGHNGHEYTSIAKRMFDDGLITRQQWNLRGLTEYFKSHPEMQDKYLWMNHRTVFFAERPGGPFGKLNVPITPKGSIATDKEVYPRAMPAFLAVEIPRTDDPTQKFMFNGFMMDQDAGGAIRAAGRCDIYMGAGDRAEAEAGYQFSEGALYYIAIKPELVGNYASPLPGEKKPGK